jgi:hypothetical protein
MQDWCPVSRTSVEKFNAMKEVTGVGGRRDDGRKIKERTVELIFRARIFYHLRSPRIDSKESIPPAYVAWRAGTTTLFLLGS